MKLDKLVYFNEKILPNDLKTFNSNDLAKYLRNKIQYNGLELYNNPIKYQPETSKEEKIIDMRRNQFEEFNKLVQNKKTVYNQNNNSMIETTKEEIIMNRKIIETQKINPNRQNL